MASFTLVTAWVVLIFVALLQLSLSLYVRAVLTDAAGEGARRAAILAGDEQAAVGRAKEVMQMSLGQNYVKSLKVLKTDVETPSGFSLGGQLHAVEVVITAPYPFLGGMFPSLEMEVRGRGIVESDLPGQVG